MSSSRARLGRASPGARTRSTNDLQFVYALLLLRLVIYKVNEVYWRLESLRCE